ncbi:MAG TPA: CocE/NonD family hydrolase [Opitutaceae bacterium]|jgi:hypothetical protein
MTRFLRSTFTGAALAALAVAAPRAHAQSLNDPPENSIKAHYTKYDYRIPMRDGVHLFTSVYVPKDTSQSWPFLMVRTPYSVQPYGADSYPDHLGPTEEFDKAGYIFVFQDVRGRYMSEGKYDILTPHIDVKKGPQDVDESSDCYDTIEFLLRHVADNNGKVGLLGTSYPGFYAAASMIDSHPALKASSPQAPVTDFYMMDDFYRGGAFMLGSNFGFLGHFSPMANPTLPPKVYVPYIFPIPDRYEFHLHMGPLEAADKYYDAPNPYYKEAIEHDTYDAFWKARAIAGHMKNVHCAVLAVGGWFDAEDIAGPMRTYHSVAKFNPDTPDKLVEGPWPHGGWTRAGSDHLGDVDFRSDTAAYFRIHIQFPFFEHYLKGKGGDLPNAMVFETGTNVWRSYDVWPPKSVQPRKLYLRAGGRLSFEPPGPDEGRDEYVSDPAHPVPFVSYPIESVPQRYMVDDQRFAARRTDVLTYESEPLEEDLTIAGPVSPRLFVATSGTDSDFVVKLIDVYPDSYPNPERPPEIKGNSAYPPPVMGGYQQLVRGEPMRAKFRNSFEKPEAMPPGVVVPLNFDMPDLNHTFVRGHRIMVQIQSSWFPLVDLNPQTFTHIPTAKPEDYKKATEQVEHSAASPSAVEVQVLPRT